MVPVLYFVSFFILGTAFGSPLVLSEEPEPNNSGRSLGIINSTYTTIGDYPIDVAFLISNNIWGVGTIINQLWILTTAFNCLWVDPSYISVRVGSSNWTNDGLVIPAQACIIHPNYTGTYANNIALVKLTANITFGPNSKLGYYKVSKTLNVPGSEFTVSGWGVRSPSYAKETQLQSISLTILENEECSKTYNMTEAEGSFCAQNVNGGPCVFDYGAPMNKKRIVMGLYQGSKDCTKPDLYPGLFVDVYRYIEWITGVIANN